MLSEYDFSKGVRGPVRTNPGKTRITIWIDTGVLNWFRTEAERAGRGYQTTMNEALRMYAEGDHRPMVQVLREVIRAELRAVLKAS